MSLIHYTITMARKAGAAVFCMAIGAIPIVIVVLSPGRSGGVFLLGYLSALVTLPFVGIGLFKAADILFRGQWLNGVAGFLIYGVLVILIFFAAIAWEFFGAG